MADTHQRAMAEDAANVSDQQAATVRRRELRLVQNCDAIRAPVVKFQAVAVTTV
jgi:hypothetical protein